MAVSTLVAIRFPYVDMNAQAVLDAENVVVVRDESHDSDIDVAGGVGGGGGAHAVNDEAVDVGVGDNSGGGGAGVDVDILVDDAHAETSGIGHDENQSVGNAETVSF